MVPAVAFQIPLRQPQLIDFGPLILTSFDQQEKQIPPSQGDHTPPSSSCK